MRYYVVCTFALIAMLNASLAASSITAYDNQTAYVTSNHVFYNDEVAQGFVRLNEGFTVMPPHACANLDLLFSVSGGIDLRETSTIRLLKDLEFDSGVTLTTGGNIDGRGHTLILNGDFRVPAGKVLHFNGDTIIDAQGNEIVIGENAQIFIDTNVTLTIANAVIKNTRNAPTYPAMRCAALTSKLAFDNVAFAPVGDFWFPQGQLFVHGEVFFTGTSALVYHSPVPCFVAKNSCLYLDHAITFSVAPATFTDAPYSLTMTYTNNNFIKMADQTSMLYCDGCSLQTTETGLRLTRGTVILDNRVQFKSDSTLTLTSVTLQALQNVSLGADVYSTDWSPDRRYIAVGTTVNFGALAIRVYQFNGTTLTLAASASYGTRVWAVRWSPDGRYLAVGGLGPTNNNEVQVYSFNGTALTLITNAQVDYDSDVYSVAWSPDGRYLAIGGNSPTVNKVRVYSFDGTALALIPGAQVNYGFDVRSVTWSPDGRYLALGGDNFMGGNELRVYTFNGTTLSLCVQLDYGAIIYSLSWSPDGRYLAVGGNAPTSGNILKIYTFNGTELVLNAQADFGEYVYSLAWSPNGQYVVVGGYHPTGSSALQVYRFNGTTLIPCAQTNYGELVWSVAWSPDGQYLSIMWSSPEKIEICRADYTQPTTPQASTYSIVFGDSAKGSNYDAHLRLKPGASLDLIGKMLYDCVDAGSEPSAG
jgi:WD40 repeat protein